MESMYGPNQGQMYGRYDASGPNVDARYHTGGKPMIPQQPHPHQVHPQQSPQRCVMFV